jgi:hypothetical protein
LLTCVVAGVAFFNIYDGLHYRNPRVVELVIKAANDLKGKLTSTKLILTFVRLEIEDDKALNDLIAHHDLQHINIYHCAQG